MKLKNTIEVLIEGKIPFESVEERAASASVDTNVRNIEALEKDDDMKSFKFVLSAHQGAPADRSPDRPEP